MESLVDDPGGPLWKESGLNRKLNVRLGRAYRSYLRCVEAMQAAIKDLWSRLELDERGAVSLNFVPPRSYRY